MNLRNLYTLTALTLNVAVPLALAACGGDTNGQKNGAGGSLASSGGTATASGGQSGSRNTGGAPGAGTAGATGGIACGKNTCGAGQYCCDPYCGTCAPKGASCVQGCADPTPPLPTCATNADCSVAADYCTGCDCRVLGPGGTIPPCSGPGVNCDADPCMNTSAACVNGICVAQKTVTPVGKCTSDGDCTLFDHNCPESACECVSLAKGEKPPACGPGPVPQCLIASCQLKTAACVNAGCVAK